MAWNPKWAGGVDSIKLCDPYSFLYEIIEALNERNGATMRPSLPLPVKLNVFDIMNSIQSIISILITLFANHTDNGGDWTGESSIYSIAPAWTEADILTAIGASSRLDPENLHVSADWLIQQYKILNLLKWTALSFHYTAINPDDFRTKRYGGAGNTNDWANSVSDFNSLAWGSVVGSFPFLEGAGHYGFNNPTGDIAITRVRARYELENNTPFDFNFDSYFLDYLRRHDSSKYVNNDYPQSTEKLTYLLENNKSLSSSDSIILTIGDFGNVSMPNPIDIGVEVAGYQEYNSFNSTYKIVKKFDGPNGFEYKDW